jgi:hypothetical protein
VDLLNLDGGIEQHCDLEYAKTNDLTRKQVRRVEHAWMVFWRRTASQDRAVSKKKAKINKARYVGMVLDSQRGQGRTGRLPVGRLCKPIAGDARSILSKHIAKDG